MSQPDKVLQIASALQKFMGLERVKGRVLVVANLKPRQMGGFKS
jgi:tRNA-binding EMAP/Myf-like protein